MGDEDEDVEVEGGDVDCMSGRTASSNFSGIARNDGTEYLTDKRVGTMETINQTVETETNQSCVCTRVPSQDHSKIPL